MNTLVPLLAELDAWATEGRQATLWWRDDDATRPTAKLEALLEVAEASGVAPVLAVIPFMATAALAERLARAPAMRVWQHGLRHVNRVAVGQKSQELALTCKFQALRLEPLPTALNPDRLGAKGGEGADILRALVQGRKRLQALFGAQFNPALAPPWNRIEPELVPNLAAAGFAALSTTKARRAPNAAPGLQQINTHVDVIDWRGGRGFIGEAATANALARHLTARRVGKSDPTEPTGLLTHHLVMDARAWGFIRALFLNTKKHPAASWRAPLI